MENGQKSISDLFESRRIFNIPRYQRGYSWEEKQLQDFISDLASPNPGSPDSEDIAGQEIAGQGTSGKAKTGKAPGRDYFFGTMLLQIRPSEGHFKIIDIVDGQQRLTTLVIFMRLLLQKLQAAGDDVAILHESYVQYRSQYKLRVLEYDNEFFQRFIMEDGSAENEGVKNSSVKGVLVQNAPAAERENEREIAGDTEPEIKTPSQRRMMEAKAFFAGVLEDASIETARYYRERIERAKVLTYAVSDNAEATLIFETTNDRGKPLSSLEKIKSFLMYQVFLCARQPEKHLDVLQARFGAIYREYEELRMRCWFLDEDDILRNHYIAFEAKGIADGLGSITRHLSLVKDRIHALSLDPGTREEATDFIDRYSEGLAETFALSNALAGRLSGNLSNIVHLKRLANFLPLLLVALQHDHSEEKQHFERVARLLEIFSFRVYGIRKRKVNNAALVKRLFALAQDFKGDYASLTGELKDLIGEYCSDYEFEKRLDSPTFYEDIASNELTYLLWQYENFVRAPRGGAPSSHSFIPYRMFRNLCVEHIIPQNPRLLPPGISEAFYRQRVHSLGNLALDVGGENAAKSNESFAVKYHYYYRHSRFKSQEELIDFVDLETEEWSEESVLTRHHKLMKFALKRWDYKPV